MNAQQLVWLIAILQLALLIECRHHHRQRHHNHERKVRLRQAHLPTPEPKLWNAYKSPNLRQRPQHYHIPHKNRIVLGNKGRRRHHHSQRKIAKPRLHGKRSLLTKNRENIRLRRKFQRMAKGEDIQRRDAYDRDLTPAFYKGGRVEELYSDEKAPYDRPAYLPIGNAGGKNEYMPQQDDVGYPIAAAYRSR